MSLGDPQLAEGAVRIVLRQAQVAEEHVEQGAHLAGTGGAGEGAGQRLRRRQVAHVDRHVGEGERDRRGPRAPQRLDHLAGRRRVARGTGVKGAHCEDLVALGTERDHAGRQLERLAAPVLEGGDAHEVHQRGDVVRLQLERPLEGTPRLHRAPAPQRIGVEEQVAQEEPGLDVVRVGIGDGVVVRLRRGHIAREPGALGIEEQAVVGGEAVAVLRAEVGELARQLVHGAAAGRGGEAVVGEGERFVRGDRALQRLHCVVVAAGAEHRLAVEVRLERLHGAGGDHGEPRQAGAGAGVELPEELPRQLVHDLEELGDALAHRLHGDAGAARLVIDRGGHGDPPAGAHDGAEHEPAGAEAAGGGERAAQVLLFPPLALELAEQGAGVHGAEVAGAVELGAEEVHHAVAQVGERRVAADGEGEDGNGRGVGVGRREQGGALAGAVEKVGEAALGSGVAGGERGCPPREARRVLEPVETLGVGGELPGGRDGKAAEPGALLVEPVLELGGVGDVEALEELAAVEVERAGEVAAVERAGEGGGVAPHGFFRRGDLVIPPARQRLRPECAAQEVEAPPERGAGVRRVAVRPEQREQRIPPMEPPRRRGREIREQRQPLRLRQHRSRIRPVRAAEIGGAEGVEVDHSGNLHVVGIGCSIDRPRRAETRRAENSNSN